MSAFDEAQATLYQAPLASFVSERKRLAAELKLAGDKDAAARLSKLARPSPSAWVVNQLWWHEHEAFEALLAAAARIKQGEREASQAHRQALNRLREGAAHLLQAAGNAASEPTLRRATTTLSALAASGGFGPEPAGALTADRDPPGFETLGFAAAPSASMKAAHDEQAAARKDEAERRRVEDEARQQRLAERGRLSALLRETEQRRDAQQRDLTRLRAEVETAQQSLEASQAMLAELELQLSSL